VIAVINPILRGWVNYFRVGMSAPVIEVQRTPK
jgi:Group II intron, maturase-specific domain